MRLGIIGSGMIVKEFLSISSIVGELEVEAILGTKRSYEKVEKLKADYGIKKATYDMDEFLNIDLDCIYIGVPNNLHFEFTKKILEAGINVIVEKPITSNYKEAKILSEIAKAKGLFLFEAISNQYLPNYKKIKELVSQMGNIKIVQFNYSQYSSRYDAFKEGRILPVFNP